MHHLAASTGRVAASSSSSRPSTGNRPGRLLLCSRLWHRFFIFLLDCDDFNNFNKKKISEMTDWCWWNELSIAKVIDRVVYCTSYSSWLLWWDCGQHLFTVWANANRKIKFNSKVTERQVTRWRYSAVAFTVYIKRKKKENIWFTSNDFRCCAAPLAVHSCTLRKPHKFGHVALHVAGDDEWVEVRRGKDRISYLWEHRAVNAGYNWTSMDRDPYSVARRQFVEQDQRKDTSGSPLNTWAIPSPPLSR